MALRLLLAVTVVAGCAVALSGATDHIVGDRTFCNPNINHTLWSGNHTFFVGDLICKPPPLHFSCIVMKKLHLLFFAISFETFFFNVFARAVQRSGTRRGRTTCSR
jgi:hypothetical protein